jgi:hypothetical protein
MFQLKIPTAKLGKREAVKAEDIGTMQEDMGQAGGPPSLGTSTAHCNP